MDRLVFTYEAGKASVVEIRKDAIDIYNYSVLFRELLKVISDSGTKQVVLDLKQVNAVDSVGVGLLARFRDTARQHGVNVAVVCTNKSILKILELLNMKEAVNTRGSIGGAIIDPE
ncbi:MAG TPA: STAS domain-containing protein [Spirochaetota bacterium]|nr:STAS domain-containing protein [Spirochaetota bacterium]HPC43296.1 STAS domain-containing protein [Spirochaetota bacterium]HPL18667.1 STAS domain-containing protein [Spirochaetota bacterium]HQF07715.1 STAS domain-containing protein [Spirochaetota bacterium]HQH99304.1 STAS domain-containing protein [Spirochaetota bacterium]